MESFDCCFTKNESGDVTGDTTSDDNTWKNRTFATVQNCFDFYTDYAHHKGFSVRIGTHVNREIGGVSVVRYIYYSCNKEGFKNNSLNDPEYGHDVDKVLVHSNEKQRQFKEERIGCPAKIRFKYVPDKCHYIITYWNDDHNHECHPTELSHFIRSNRKISDTQAIIIEANNEAGLSNKSSYDLLCQSSGGIQSAGFLKIDMKNFLRGRRTRDMSAGYLSILLQFLCHESQSKPSFFYDIQLDQDSLITNIFWADGVMQHDYDCFGDVVSLDTTFKTNKEFFPLAAFLGFSHHRQSCLFGAALLHDQSSETFEWLLHVFLKCMNGKKPVSIFTDQDAAMKKAITVVLPDTFHGLCSWHICQNAAKNLGSLGTKKFFTCFHFLINEVDDEVEFEYNWKLMIDDCFHGVLHKWLEFIYPFRMHWSSAWVKMHFTGGLKSTQISESFNAFLRDYVSIRYSLPQFFHNFNIMLDRMRDKLNKSVYESIQFLPSIRFNHSAIVKQAAGLYTPSIFQLFQDQYSLSFEYFIETDTLSISSMRKVYSVFKFDPIDHNIRLDERRVVIDLKNVEWICSCRKFDQWGILCCHILRVVDILSSSGCHVDLRVIPDKYLLKRWSRNARRNVGTWTLPKSDDESSSSSYGLRYQAFCSSMIRLSSRICIDDETYSFFMKEVNEVLARVDLRKNTSVSVPPPISFQSESKVAGEIMSRVNSAKGIKKRSNPNKSNKRLKSEREIGIERFKAKRKFLKNNQSSLISAEISAESDQNLLNVSNDV